MVAEAQSSSVTHPSHLLVCMLVRGGIIIKATKHVTRIRICTGPQRQGINKGIWVGTESSSVASLLCYYITYLPIGNIYIVIRATTKLR